MKMREQKNRIPLGWRFLMLEYFSTLPILTVWVLLEMGRQLYAPSSRETRLGGNISGRSTK